MSPVVRTTAVYTAGRLGLFVLFALLIWSASGLVGHEVNGFPLLLLALLTSSVAAYQLLAVPREKMALALADRRPAEDDGT